VSLSEIDLKLRLSKMHRRAQAAEKAVHDLQDQYANLRAKYDVARQAIIALGYVRSSVWGSYRLVRREPLNYDAWNEFVDSIKTEIAAERHDGGAK